MAGVIYQGDQGTILQLTIRDSGQVVDLTNATVQVLIRLKDMGNLKTATIIDAVNGKCRIILNSQDIQYEGIYQLQSTVLFADGTKFSSTIQRFTVEKKMGYIPSTSGGGTGGSTEIIGGNNGHILVNGVDVKVYDDTTIKTDISTLRNSDTATNNNFNSINSSLSDVNTSLNDLNSKKHNHSNLSVLNLLTTDGTNLLFNNYKVGGSEIAQSSTNGNLKVNGVDIKVYDDQTLVGLINELNQYKYLLRRLGISTNGILTIDGIEITAPTSPTITVIDGGTFSTVTFDSNIDGGSFTSVPTENPIDGGTF